MKKRTLRVLAIDLSAKGFGYALIDAKWGLLDHGFSTFGKQGDAAFVARLSTHIERGRPSVLALENLYAPSQRPAALRRQALAIQFVADRQMGLCQVSRTIVRAFFGEVTKAAIAAAIANRFPELRRRRPRVRALWQAEDTRMNLFDAAALALVVLGVPTN